VNPGPIPGLDAGAKVGSYRLWRLLGRGALGTVYLAFDVEGSAIALKVYPLAGEGSAGVLDAFRRESELGARLRHPGIVRTLATGDDGRYAFVAMEFVAGSDLAPYTRRAELLGVPVAMKVVEQVARALGHAHGQGVIHRDIKPANVLVDLPAQVVKVSDFGLARLGDVFGSRTGVIAGTPAYMSPEQLVESAVDHRTDLYSLGIVLFELLTGRRPHQGETMGELLRQVASVAPPDLAAVRPGLPAGLVSLVNDLLAREARHRPPDGHVVAERLSVLGASWEHLGSKSRG